MMKTLPLKDIVLRDPVLATRQRTCREVTIPSSLQKCEDTGRVAALQLNWHEPMPHKPHIFWDSDVAKVIEGAAYDLGTSEHPNPETAKELDKIIKLFISAQQPDGYLNSYFSTVSPDKRWTNLHEWHELYCAGHLLEAAIAVKTMLNRDDLLQTMLRYMDYIAQVFGRGEGQKRGYPGHQEIELALLRYYELSGDQKYRDLALYFLSERGQKPNYFVAEGMGEEHLIEEQAHRPVREETEAVGHAVRAGYLYTAMAMAAQDADDPTLHEVCEQLFLDITQKKMYITGGIGSTFVAEAFSKAYDLTNSSLMYAESCAAISMVYFFHAMLQDGRDRVMYADALERVLYNGALSGISLSGDKFFYTNYLELSEATAFYNSGAAERQEWFGCSCCPTNYCRFLMEYGQYLTGVDMDTRTFYLHIPAAQQVALRLDGQEIPLQITGRYPYTGDFVVEIGAAATFTLALRIPSWCTSPAEIRCAGELLQGHPGSYIRLTRAWQSGDRVEVVLPMQVRCTHCHVSVTDNVGRFALEYGPLVYCLEGVDNPAKIQQMLVPENQSFQLTSVSGLPEGTVAITGEAFYETAPAGAETALYYSGAPERHPAQFLAIPYALWQNRGKTDMAVWIRCADSRES